MQYASNILPFLTFQSVCPGTQSVHFEGSAAVGSLREFLVVWGILVDMSGLYLSLGSAEAASFEMKAQVTLGVLVSVPALMIA
jgi:hypothetical protein